MEDDPLKYEAAKELIASKQLIQRTIYLLDLTHASEKERNIVVRLRKILNEIIDTIKDLE